MAPCPACALFTQPIEKRVNEKTGGVRADLGVELFGDDLDLLAAKAGDVLVVLRSVPGAADATAEQLTGQSVPRSGRVEVRLPVLIRVSTETLALPTHGL